MLKEIPLYGRTEATETVEETPPTARLEGAITVGELEDARLGFFHSLARRFGREFKERHGDDLFAQALYEFSRKIEEGEEIRNTAAWITRCAWNRSKTEMEARAWRPEPVPTESLPTEPVADPSWQPEESFLSEDRVRKLEEAVDQLPEYQRELLARHYFEGESVREASRRMGWSEGKGARAHNAARKKLREVFAGLHSSDLEFVGALSFLSLAASARGGPAEIPGGLDAALERTGHAACDAWHKAFDLARHPLGRGRAAEIVGAARQVPGRLSQPWRRVVSGPVAETAATAGDAPGRALEVCKLLTVCAVSGVAVTAGVVGTGGGHHRLDPTSIRPVPRHAQGDHPGEDTAMATPAVPAAEGTRADTAPSEPHRPESPRSEPAAVAHSISGSSAAAGRTAKDHGPELEEDEVEEAATRREAFGPFEGRGEGGPTESQSSGAEVESLSDAKSSSSSTAEAAEPSSAPAPKEAAEKQAAGEMFGGALR